MSHVTKTSQAAPFGVEIAMPAPTPRAQQASYLALKRLVDVVGASLGLLLLFPLFFVISAAIWSNDRGPVLYKQQRVGRGGRLFWMYKFRSMRQDADKVLKDLLEAEPALRSEFEQTYKLKNDPRILPCGRFLRGSSLDELPQLLNVLAGEMSLVGPRPIVQNEAQKLGTWFETYKLMTPGCAGLWQCSGRNDTTYEERVELNQEYFSTASIRTDFFVMWKTFLSIIGQRGAY